MPTRRQERVAKRIVQELVEAIRNLKHVSLGFVTVTKCEVSPDLRHANVFVSFWGGEEEIAKGMETLHRHASKLRGMIARPLGIKVTPDLHFEFDDSLEKVDRINRLIRDARSTDANPNPLSPEEEAALLAANAPAQGGKPKRDAGLDPFEVARRDVEEELYGEDGIDGDGEADGADDDWTPINLDELPDDGEEEDEEGK